MPDRPTATIVIPTRRRASYLDVALNSIMPQAAAAGAEVLVVSDGPDLPTEAVTRRHRVRRLELPVGSGLNAGRNVGAGAASSEFVVFVDDDVEVLDGWLEALVGAANQHPDYGVFGGPIIPLLEGGGPRACGREPPPITVLDRGPDDRVVPFVWGANFAVRRDAIRTTGPFDESIRGGRGDEEEWLIRYRSAGGLVLYLAEARLLHRRSRQDSRLSRLAIAQYHLGQASRRSDRRKGLAPSGFREVRLLAGGIWHLLARRCGYGAVFAAHSAGRLREMSREQTD